MWDVERKERIISSFDEIVLATEKSRYYDHIKTSFKYHPMVNFLLDAKFPYIFGIEKAA